MLAGVGALALLAIVTIGALALTGGDDGNAQVADEPESNPTTSLTLFGADVADPDVDPEDPDAAANEPVAANGRETTEAEPAATIEAIPASTEGPQPETTVAPSAETTAEPVAETTIPITTVAPSTSIAETAADTGDDEVPESKAVVREGQIFLEGAVPDAASGEAIAALAAEILGADNVFNNYVIDPRAGDPNLGNVTVEDTINFATGSSFILPEGEVLLNQGLALLTIRPAMTITIVGHTDSLGTDEYNVELSLERAESVKAWFTERGVDPARLTTEGKGESEPLADNDTQDGRRINRRIQFFLENILG